MNDKLTDWVRQLVPVAWAWGVAWLVAKGAPDWVTGLLDQVPMDVLQYAVLAIVYAVLVKVEPYLPAFLRTLLMGSPKLPTYESK
jgi:hypothetical protein